MTPEVINGLFAVGGALLGAIVAGGFSIYLHNKNKTKKELTALSTRPSKLIAVDDQIASDVKISVSGEEVNTVYLADYTILNSGNEVLTDIQVPFRFEGEGKLLVFNFKDANYALLSQEEACAITGDLEASIKAEYLNPGDQLVTRAMFSGKPRRWHVDFRQPGAKLVQRLDIEGTAPDVLSKAFFDVIRRNWILDSYLRLVVPSYRRYREREVEREKST